MKFSGAVLLSGAALSAAQSLGDLPACGQLCINNMIGIAQNQFGCPAGNATCYCSNKNFGLGVRDCSNQACPNSQQAQSAIAYEFAYCASALSAGGGGSGGSSTTTSGGSATGMSSMVSTTTVGGGKGGNGGNGGALASATSHISAVKASPGVFVVGPDHTISAGGPVYSSNNGYVYTAQRSDVLVSGSGPSQLATVVPSAVFTTALSSGSSSASNGGNGGNGGAGGALAGATKGISSVSGTMGEYVVASSHTISNGGKGFTTDGTAYSAIQTGVVIAAKGQTTTYAATGGSGSGSGGKGNGNNGGNGGGAAGLAGATKGISAVSGTKGEYVVASTHTISAGGNGFTTAGTMYTAVQTGVVIAAKGATTTYATTAGGSGGGAGGAGGMSSGGSGGGSSMSSTSSQSGFAAPAFATAAPGLIGAAALAVLAL